MRNNLRNRLLPETLVNAAGKPFYAGRWHRVDVEGIQSISALSRLPLIDKFDYVQGGGSFAPSGWPEDGFVNHTSGTSGEPMYRYRSSSEIQYIRDFFAALTRRASRQTPGLVLSTNLAAVAHGAAISVPYPAPVIECDMEGPDGVEKVIDLLSRPRLVRGAWQYITDLDLGAHQLILLTSTLASRRVDPSTSFKVRLARISGAYVSRPTIDRISRFWGGIEVREHFSLSEIFGGASLCGRCSWYHLDPFVVGEVVNLGSEEIVRSGAGVLVLTELYPFVQANPLIRYWTADLVEATETVCDPGSPSFRYLGRIFSRRGHVARGPAKVREEDATESVVLGEGRTGRLVPLLRPATLIDFLSSLGPVARWGIFGKSLEPIEDPLSLGRPKFTARLGTTASGYSVLHINVETKPDGQMDSEKLVRQIRTAVLSQNPELAATVTCGRCGLLVTTSAPSE